MTRALTFPLFVFCLFFDGAAHASCRATPLGESPSSYVAYLGGALKANGVKAITDMGMRGDKHGYVIEPLSETLIISTDGGEITEIATTIDDPTPKAEVQLLFVTSATLYRYSGRAEPSEALTAVMDTLSSHREMGEFRLDVGPTTAIFTRTPAALIVKIARPDCT